MTSICPLCHKDDLIRKISAIALEGRQTGRISGLYGGIVQTSNESGLVGGYTALDSNSITDIARLLSSPPEPEQPSGLSFSCLFWVGILMALFPLGFFFYFVGFSCVGSITNYQPEALSHISGIASIIIFVVISFILLRKLNHKILAQDENRYIRQKNSWNAKMECWKRLYYCLRDNIVFDPESGESFPPQSTRQYLKKIGSAKASSQAQS